MKSLVGCMAGFALAVTAANGQLSFTNALPGTFVDISGTGTALDLADDGEATIASTIGNSVFAAGDVRVGNNGGIGFGLTTGDLTAGNATIPATGGISGAFGLTPAKQTLLAYWDDLDSDTGNVYWQEIGDMLIIQWNDRPHFSNSADHATFQIQIFGSGPVLAQYLYQTIDGSPNFLGGTSATIGYTDGTSGANAGNNILFSFNTAAAVANGTVLSLIPTPGTAGVLALGGLLAARRRRA